MNKKTVIRTQNSHFKGERLGIQFKEGVAEVDKLSADQKSWFERNGYTVESPAVEQAAKASDPEKTVSAAEKKAAEKAAKDAAAKSAAEKPSGSKSTESGSSEGASQ